MSQDKKQTKLLGSALVRGAFKQSFIKLSPRYMVKNPVMFTVEIGTFIMPAFVFGLQWAKHHKAAWYTT